jgi:hypothetical protein
MPRHLRRPGKEDRTRMSRTGIENVETEGDLARGMGIAIAMLIALFAVGIAMFVIQQGTAHSTPHVKNVPGGTTAVALPSNPPPAAAAERAPR